MPLPDPESTDAAWLLTIVEEARDKAEQSGLDGVASLLRICVMVLKPSVGEPESRCE